MRENERERERWSETEVALERETEKGVGRETEKGVQKEREGGKEEREREIFCLDSLLSHSKCCAHILAIYISG